MYKERIFESFKRLKKSVVIQLYINLYEDREELLENHQKVLKNWGNKIAELEKENAKLKAQLEDVIVQNINGMDNENT